MKAGIYYEISIIIVCKENAFMTLFKKKTPKFSSAQGGGADKLIHYLEGEGCLCMHSCFTCMVCESEYLPSEMNFLYSDLGLDVQTWFLHKGLNL